MELMKLATTEQLAHASEIVTKFKDVPTIAPAHAPLPSSVLAMDVKEGKGDDKAPIVVRKDSTPLETAIGTFVTFCTDRVKLTLGLVFHTLFHDDCACRDVEYERRQSQAEREEHHDPKVFIV